MTVEIKKDTSSATALDRGDVRVKHEAGVGGAIRSFLDRVRLGEVGQQGAAVVAEAQGVAQQQLGFEVGVIDAGTAQAVPGGKVRVAGGGHSNESSSF